MSSTPPPSPTPSLSAQVSRAVIWNTLFVPLRMLAEVAATALKLTVLPLAAYGLLALVSGAAAAFGTWIDLGTTRALPKFIPETMRQRGAAGVLKLLLGVFSVQSVILLGIATSLIWQQQWYLDSLEARVHADTRIDDASQSLLHAILASHGWLFIVVILCMLLMGVLYDMLMAYLNSFFKQQAWNGIALLAGLLPQLLAVAAIVGAQLSDEPLRWSIIGILISSALAPSIAVGVATWQVYRVWQQDTPHSSTESTTPFGNWRAWLPAGFLRYTGVSYLMTMTDFLASKSFAVYLTSSISDAAMLWAGASLVGMVLSYLYTPLVGITVPLFTRVRAGEGGSILGAYQSIVRIQILLLVPGAVALMLLAKPALQILTPQYVDAVWVVYVLVPCLFLESLLTVAHNVMIVYEELTLVTVGRLLTLIVIPLGWLFGAWYGVVGLALAFGLARVCAGIWITAWGSARLKLRWPMAFTLRVCGGATLMGLCIFAVSWIIPPVANDSSTLYRLSQLPVYGVVALVAAGVFFFGLRLSGGLDPDDRNQLTKVKLPFKDYLLRYL